VLSPIVSPSTAPAGPPTERKTKQHPRGFVGTPIGDRCRFGGCSACSIAVVFVVVAAVAAVVLADIRIQVLDPKNSKLPGLLATPSLVVADEIVVFLPSVASGSIPVVADGTESGQSVPGTHQQASFAFVFVFAFAFVFLLFLFVFFVLVLFVSVFCCLCAGFSW